MPFLNYLLSCSYGLIKVYRALHTWPWNCQRNFKAFQALTKKSKGDLLPRVINCQVGVPEKPAQNSSRIISLLLMLTKMSFCNMKTDYGALFCKTFFSNCSIPTMTDKLFWPRVVFMCKDRDSKMRRATRKKCSWVMTRFIPIIKK